MNRVRKYCIYIFVFVTICYIAMAFVFQAIYGNKKTDLNRLIISGIYYSANDEDNEEVFSSYNEINTKNLSKLVIKGHSENNIIKGDKIMHLIVKSRVKISINQNLIYDSGDDLFLRWDYFFSPGISTEDEIEIIIEPLTQRYNHNFFKKYLNNIFYGSEHDLFAYKFKENLFNVFACLIIIGFSTAMLVAYFVYSSFKIKGTEIYLSCALLLISGALFCFFDYNYITLLIKKPALINGLDFIMKMLYCGLMFIYLFSFIKIKINKIISKVIILLWMLFYTMCFIRRLFFLYPNVYTTDAIIGIMGIIMVLYELMFIYDIARAGNKSILPVLISAVIISMTTIIESVYYIKYNVFLHEIFVFALLLFAVLNLSFMIKSTKFRIKQAERAKELELALLSSKMDLMLSQIKPHFVFNALSVIHDLCDKDPYKAKEALDYFSTYLKSNLNSVNENRCIAFEKELRHVESYLYIEKIRKGEKLNVIYDIKCKDFEIPPLSVQTIIENAVRHGIGAKEEGGTVMLSTSEDNRFYYVIVMDDGVGFDINNCRPDDDGRKHIGMSNTKSRIKDLLNGEVIFDTSPGRGTKVTIEIPK